MKLSRPQLLHGREWYYFLLFSLLIFLFSLLIEYQNYTLLTKFSDTICEVEVLSQYTKKRKDREYYVLKLLLDDSIKFYSTANIKSSPNLEGKKVKVWLLTKRLTFFDYLQTFYLPSKVLEVYDTKSVVINYVKEQHESVMMQQLYAALFFASTLSKELRESISNLGVSHLLAISGFHLGLLSFLLFSILQLPFKMIYSRCCPYREVGRDIFIIVGSLLFIYMAYLHFPASLLRAFMMFLIAYLIFDRGLKVISMQTLLISVLLLVAFFPRLLFSLGFFLSVSGVFYIFLYIESFKRVNKFLELFLLSIWIYLMMLPLSVYLFSSFSIYHPLSIFMSILFTLFYPAVLFLHLIGYGAIFDPLLLNLMHLQKGVEVSLSSYTFYLYIFVSIISYKLKYVRSVLMIFSLLLFFYILLHLF